METEYWIGVYVVLLLGSIIVFGVGAIYGMPDELENGCIVYNDKIYCEEVNEGGEIVWK